MGLTNAERQKRYRQKLLGLARSTPAVPVSVENDDAASIALLKHSFANGVGEPLYHWGWPVRFALIALVASFHRPHPAKEAKRYQVLDAREHLTKLGRAP